MNVVREINKINERELDIGGTGSWHDDYKDSAYIFIGGLNTELTEGDVITIFSQYGEVMDVNLPRDKNTGKTKGFGFLMYEDERSTILAVDNLNGAKVLERTLRVDHVKNYKQPKVMNDEGELVEREEQSLNAKPEVIVDEGAASESSDDSGPEIDPEDPMRDYLLAKRKQEKAEKKEKKSKSKGKHKDETPEERKARKERKKEKKLKKQLGRSEAMRGVEELLNELDSRKDVDRRRGNSPRRSERSRSREVSPRIRHASVDRTRNRSPGDRRYRSRSGTPPRYSNSNKRTRAHSPEQRGHSIRSSRDDDRGSDYDRTPPRRRRDRD